jgi:hypothetical protein
MVSFYKCLHYFCILCCQSHWQTPTSFQSWIRHDFSLFLFDKAKEKALDRNWKQIYWAFACFTYLKTYPLDHLVWTCLWVSIEPPEHQWVHMDALSYCDQPQITHWVHMNANEWVRTAPEHPLSVHECHWVSMNTHWVCRNTSDHEKDLICVCIEQPWMQLVCLNNFELVLNTSWMLLSLREDLCMSIEHILKAIDYVWMLLRSVNSLEHPLSAHECLWLSIWRSECPSQGWLI